MPTEITDPERKKRILATLGTEQGVEDVRRDVAQDEGLSAIQSLLESGVGQFASGVATPAVETAAGLEELTRGRMAPGTQHALGRVRAPGGLAKTAGRLAGEVATLAAPVTGAARLGQAAARGVPYLRSALPLAAEAATVGGAEALRAPEEGQTRLGRGGTAAATTFGAGAALGALSRVIAPRMFGTKELVPEEEAFLRQMDVAADLPLVLRAKPQGAYGSIMSWAQGEPLRAAPGFRQALIKQTDEALDRWRDAMLRTAMPQRAWREVSVPSVLKAREEPAPVRKAIGEIQDWYSRQYEEVLDPHSFHMANREFVASIFRAISEVPDSVAKREILEKTINLMKGTTDKFGMLSGQRLPTLRESFYNAIKATDDGDIKQGYYRILEALDDQVLRGLRELDPEHAARYAELKGPYRNLKVLEDASVRGPASKRGGAFEPNDVVMSSIGKAKQERATRRAARGGAPLQREAERASEIYEEAVRTKTPSLYKTAALAGMLGGASYGAPGVGLPLTAGVLTSTPRFMQRYYMDQNRMQQALVDALRRPGAKQAGRAARIIAGTESTEE